MNLISILAAGLLAAPAMAVPTEPPILTVHCDKPGHAISPRLYGIFFEEINHAGDGGLYAELVRNRSFEEPAAADGAVPGWAPFTGPGPGEKSKVSLSLDTARPKQESAPHSLKMTLGGGMGGAINEGYWGIPLKKGARYIVRLDARSEGAVSGKFMVALHSAKGTPQPGVRLPGLGSEWKRFETALTATADDPDARLAISFEGSGLAWIDNVSLFPMDTWNGHRFGLRRDLAELVATLKPAFVRFPGGCYVEGGDFLKDGFRWAGTVGDIAERPGHANATWGYWSSDGLGFHEYLQWCEDLKAEPLFVVNCGLSHKEVVPIEELEPWIDECLDAIGYANGPVDSKLGALRAKSGHAAPFNLKYIEIGNENGMFDGSGGSREQYTQRYRKFYDAIKAKYPEITTISNTRIDAPMEIVDDHYYNSPSWFWDNAGLYDKADRKGPKIYVGEYAVTQGCGTGNFAAALAEAAFMTGLERNSDLVVMSSYAPMFVNIHDRKWNPDLMVFDGTKSYGTPSYHVQALFAANRPDTLLPVDVPDVVTEPMPARGGIGLGSWRTQAEFKDITVEKDGKVLYSSQFTEGAGGWKVGAGDWKTVDGAYRQSAGDEKEFTLLALPELVGSSDYTISLKARKLGGAEGFLILFRAPDASNYYWWNIGGWANRQHGIERSTADRKSDIGPRTAGTIETGRWYDVKIELAGKTIRCSLDGKAVHQVEEKATPAFAAVAGRVNANGEIVLKVVNGAETGAPMRIVFAGSAKLEPTAKATVLTSSAMNDENSLDAPRKIAPRTSTLQGVSTSFIHEFPARSLTILRLKAAD